MVSDLLLCLLPWWNSSSGTSSDHVVCQGPFTRCCYTTTLCWINSCCLESHLTCSSCHLLSVRGQLLGWYWRYLSPGMVALMNHRILCMHLVWLCSWLCHITSYTCNSLTILSSLMWASIVVYIPQWSLVRIFQMIHNTQEQLQSFFTFRS